jgi:hypothetical protein
MQQVKWTDATWLLVARAATCPCVHHVTVLGIYLFPQVVA